MDTSPDRDRRNRPVRRVLRWSGALLLVVVVAPPLVNLVIPDDSRTFDAVGLEETIHTEIRFQNTQQGLGLAGLLFTPSGEGPFPAAVIIHGSGPSVRDNGWYLTMVDYLQDHGVLVLLPDKRGSEQSAGDWRTSSFADLATDTGAAIDYLQSRGDLPISTIGVIGMSQGGWIAPIVAVNDPDVDWVVNVVGAAVPPHDQLYYEEVHNLRQMGFLPGVSNLLAYPSTWSLISLRDAEFWDAVGNTDPIHDWRRVRQPALFVYGGKDTNVPTRASVERLEALDKPNIEISVYADSGHAIEDPSGLGDSIFRRDALDDIVEFIRSK